MTNLSSHLETIISNAPSDDAPIEENKGEEEDKLELETNVLYKVWKKLISTNIVAMEIVNEVFLGAIDEDDEFEDMEDGDDGDGRDTSGCIT